MPRDAQFQEFLEALIKATGKVKAAYMELPVAGREERVYRERVYCYELYHQIRQDSEEDDPYVLWGEPDKSGHALIGLGQVKPDFIFHKPRIMSNVANVAVVEVKPIKARNEDIGKDVKTLLKFLKKGYSGGVHLVYGGYQGNAIERFREIHEQKSRRLTKGTLVLLWHKREGEPAEVVRRHPGEFLEESHAC